MIGKIAKNYLYNLLYQLVVLVVPLITAPYLARTLGASGTGTYGYVASMTSIVCTFVMLGIYNYGSRQIAYVRDDKSELSNTFWQIMSARIIIAIVGTIVYFVVAILIGKYFLLFAIYFTYMLSYFVDCTWLYIGVEDMKWVVIKNILTKILAVIGIFTLVKSYKDLPIYVEIQGSAMLISNILAYGQLGKYVGSPRLDLSRLKVDILGSINLFWPSIAATIYTQSDKVMIELMTGATNEVAFYDYSEKIVAIPLTFIIVLNTVMMPRIANEYKKGNNETISNLINAAAQFSLFLAVPMVLGLMAIADKLVPWYLGQEFLPTISAIMLISPIIITNSMTGISGGQYFTATNQIKVLVISQFLAAVANVIINSILIPQFGFLGAAIATLITSISCAIAQYVYLLKQIKLEGLFIEALKCVIAAFIMFAIIKFCTGRMLANPVTNLVQVLLGISIYLLLGRSLKIKALEYFLNRIKKFIYK